MAMPQRPEGHSRAWPVLAAAVVALVIGVHAWPIIAGGGEVIYGYGGDNWKNVYTFVYHILHDPEATLTQALHYPFGEHVVMADAQPLLSNALRPLARLGLLGERGATAIVLYLPLLSFPLAALAVYAVLRSLGLARVWAAGWAVPVVLLQGQNYRYFGHYALGYGWVVPLLLWLWLRARHRKYDWRSSAWVGAALLASAMLHLYYLGLGGALLLALLGFDLLWHVRRPGHWRRVGLASVVQVGLPAVAAVALTRVPDPYDDRIAQPYGLFEYRGYLWDWLVDYRLPHWAWIKEHVWQHGGSSGDPTAYVGVAFLLAALGLVVRKLILWLRRRPLEPVRSPTDAAWAADRSSLSPAHPRDREADRLSLVLAAAGIALAIFSFGFPLAERGEFYDTVREYAGPLKQLRALKRFAWAAYYPLCVTVFAGLTHWLAPRRGGGAAWGQALLALGITVATAEGVLSLTHYTPPMTNHVLAEQREELKAALDTIDVPVSAVLPVPYFSVGSEDFGVGEVGHGLYTGTYPSLATGLPNVGLYMSRTSLSETLETVPLARSWWNVPAVLTRLGARHVLVSVDLAAWQQEWVRETYQAVYDATREVYRSDEVSIRLLDTADLPAITLARRGDYLRRYFGETTLGAIDSIATFAQDGQRDDGLPFARLSLDAVGEVEGLFGSKGALLREDSRTVVEVPLPPGFTAGEAMTMGAHLRLEGQGQILGLLEVDYLGADGSVLGSIGYHAAHYWREVYGRWVYFEAPISPPAATVALRFRVRAGRPTRAVGGVVDEITLRRPGTHYAYPLPTGAYVVNGRVWDPI